MSTGDERQRLAAILAADAVGYSRHMEADERATAAALDAARGVFRSQVEARQGRVVNMVGDSVLAFFQTAAGAVTAALEVQRALAELSRDVPPERRLLFRIGVHLGDVVEKADGDVYGDGVNIAARLQSMAPPGGIVVSEAVRGAVKSRIAAAFDDLGPQAVKNIAEPVHAFAVREAGSAPAAAAASLAPPRSARRLVRLVGGVGAAVVAVLAVGVALWPRPTPPPQAAPPPAVAAVPGTPAPTTPVPSPAPTPAPAAVAAPAAAPAPMPLPASVPTPVPADKPSIAVLPFDNMSGDPAQAYFADGIAEDLITDLSKVDGLFVIARNSTFVYRGRARDAREIARALGVRFVLEGSVRRAGDDVRVNAQLIDGATGGHVWAERYDGSLTNIFGLQDSVARSVVAALAVRLTSDDRARVANRGTANAQAYDAFLKGWGHYLRQTPDGFRAAIADFENAAKLDPNYSRAYAALAATYWEIYTRYWAQSMGIRDSRRQPELHLAKAMRDPTPLAYQVSSAILVHRRQHEEAIVEAKRAIAADPNDADGYAALSRALSFAGRPREALEAIERAMRLNPHFPSIYEYLRGLALFGMDRLPEAATSLERASAMNRDDYWSMRLLLATYGLLGRGDDAARLAEAAEKTRQSHFDPLSIRGVSFWYPFANADDSGRFTTGLRRAGVPD